MLVFQSIYEGFNMPEKQPYPRNVSFLGGSPHAEYHERYDNALYRKLARDVSRFYTKPVDHPAVYNVMNAVTDAALSLCGHGNRKPVEKLRYMIVWGVGGKQLGFLVDEYLLRFDIFGTYDGMYQIDFEHRAKGSMFDQTMAASRERFHARWEREQLVFDDARALTKGERVEYVLTRIEPSAFRIVWLSGNLGIHPTTARKHAKANGYAHLGGGWWSMEHNHNE